MTNPTTATFMDANTKDPELRKAIEAWEAEVKAQRASRTKVTRHDAVEVTYTRMSDATEAPEPQGIKAAVRRLVKRKAE